MRHIFSGYIRKASDREKMIANLEKNFIGNWPEEMQRCMSGLSENSMKAMIEVLVNYRIGPGVGQPLYCLYGSRETNMQVNAHLIRRYYPNAEVHIVKGYNHLVYANQQPDAYAGLIQALLTA